MGPKSCYQTEAQSDDCIMTNLVFNGDFLLIIFEFHSVPPKNVENRTGKEKI